MRVQHNSSLRRQGKAPWLVLLVLALAAAAVSVVFFEPWNALRYGTATPPTPDRQDLEAPLAQRIEERLAAVRAEPYDAAAWGRLGETYEVHEFFPQAIFCYERAARIAPEEPRWPYWLGVALRVGDQARALTNFETAARLAPTWPGPHFYAGHGLLATGRLDEAAREFERALETRPKDPAVLVGAAQVALAKQDPQGALVLLERAAAERPRTNEWRWLSAAAWRAAGDEERALEFARPNDPPPTREPFADELREQLLWNEGVSLSLVRQRAEVLLKRGEGERAIQELENYLQQVPKSVEALAALGDKFMQQGRHEDAAARYQIACTLDPTEARALSQWGIALARLGKREEAVAKLRQAVALDAANIDAQANLGAFLCGSQVATDREEGLRLLAAAVAARPDEVALRVNFGQALRANGRLEEAIAAFQRALVLAPDDLRIRFEYGVLCATAGRMEDAESAFARIVAAEPTRLEARANWVRALSTLGRHRDALAALRGSVELAPRDVGLRGQLAWMLATAPDDGVRSGAEALAIARDLSRAADDQNPELLVVLAAAEAESGDLEAAKKTLEAALVLLRPQPGESVTEPGLIGIIDQALACRKEFLAGKPFRAAAAQ